MKLLLVSALLGCFATVYAAPAEGMVRWCVKSEKELKKCHDLAANVAGFSCVRRDDSLECIQAIKREEADAITLDGGDIYIAGLHNYNLQPIIAEDYGEDSDTCYYAVAVAKKGTEFGFLDLRGKKSCHTGLGKSAGWNIPIGTLVTVGQIQWAGIEDRPVESAVSDFFNASCAPGANRDSQLCQLCMGDCSRSHNEPYYDYSGCECSNHSHVTYYTTSYYLLAAAEKASYELLCKDNTRAPIDSYKTCHLARVPAHAVVSRKDPRLANLIYSKLMAVTNFNLFSSDGYAAKNLMFKDSTQNLVQLPMTTDSFLYLGAEYMSTIRSLTKGEATHACVTSRAIKWCAVGHKEKVKCDAWTINSFTDGDSRIECQDAPTVDECIKKIMRKEADAIAVDGGEVFTAGKCGLVPVMVEQYDEGMTHTQTHHRCASSYFAVAVAKRGSGLTWTTLKGKRSCHTGLGRTAGWNIPMGLIHRRTMNCDFTTYFSKGCAPGFEVDSPFCAQCKGSGQSVGGDGSKCKASSEEQYYGYNGAFRCLVEDAGDVAFIKHTIVPEMTDGSGPVWAQNLMSSDFELLCQDGTTKPVTHFRECHLAKVPAHAVITRPESRGEVVSILLEQQARFGSSGSDSSFNMFKPDFGKNLLFKDSTKCLQEIPSGTKFQGFLGEEYMIAMQSLRECSNSTSDLEKACTFHSCQQKT
uniref:Serotransferrin n=1 Tax=Oncorhynchus kisutch TaxID=8019 RepID=A0A8C7JN02_ONCKI